jgi:hypothetical protein
MFQLFWVSKDKKRRELMDEYDAEVDAKEAILECRAALIEQDMTAKEIDEGSWEILEKK